MNDPSIFKRLSSLEEKLERIEAIEEIKQLRWEYSRACDDNHNADRLVPMFAEDAEIVLNPPFSGTIKGHVALREMFQNNPVRNGITWTFHYYLQPLITIHADQVTADASWYLWELAKMPNDQGVEEAVWVTGEYEDTYVKEDGRWKFTRIVVNVRVLSPYSDGWAKTMIRGVNAG